ncbi:hypothetical protein CIT31_28230 [Mesorhizobium wenxiniae]|uniref:Uncharacterized protein n=1 Tax=Mesorhizobium wenxiniae TaxID=2014805 RepID=A0A271KBK3_9HYPH|nr:hypothetical protein CIT31_28230 [Mesorhizobium wenxiniae]
MRRVEVFTGAGRQREWSPEGTARMVAELAQPKERLSRAQGGLPNSQTMISCGLYPCAHAQGSRLKTALKQHYPALHPRSLRSPIARRHARGQVVIGAMPMGFESKVDAERCVSLRARLASFGSHAL